MVDVAYKPIIEYEKRLDTKIDPKLFEATLIKFGERITITGILEVSTGITTTVYSVPLGYTLFLINLDIDVKQLSTDPSYTHDINIVIDKNIDSQRLFYSRTNDTFRSISANKVYPIPLKIFNLESIKIIPESRQANQIFVTIFGYLLPNSMIGETI